MCCASRVPHGPWWEAQTDAGHAERVQLFNPPTFCTVQEQEASSNKRCEVTAHPLPSVMLGAATSCLRCRGRHCSGPVSLQMSLVVLGASWVVWVRWWFRSAHCFHDSIIPTSSVWDWGGSPLADSVNSFATHVGGRSRPKRNRRQALSKRVGASVRKEAFRSPLSPK